MIKLKTLLISIIIPILIGFLGSFLGGDVNLFETINKPSFAPPGYVFGIVWPILYLLMGISSYIIYMSTATSQEKHSALQIYGLQLIVNLLWPLFFFRFEAFLFSFIWIVLLIILVVIMIYKFSKINPLSAALQIPYLLWLIFAALLNFSIFMLN